MNIEDLNTQFEQLKNTDRLNTPEDFVSLSKTALDQGRATFAFDVAKEGVSQHLKHTELAYMLALAARRSGSQSIASNQLTTLIENLEPNAKISHDILCLAGSLEKECFTKQGVQVSDQQHLVDSVRYYTDAWKMSGDYFSGINAASMCFLAEDFDRCKKIAGQVLQICLSEEKAIESSDKKNSNHYWLYATLGEVCFLLDDYEQSLDWYGLAATMATEAKLYGHIASSSKQLLMLLSIKDVDKRFIKVLTVPAVIAFTGHMIDKQWAETARFPAEIEAEVKGAISQNLEGLNAGFGYCSAACGADILFIEAMLERGAEVHIYLPFLKEDFINTSIAFAGGDWFKRFENVLEAASSVTYTTQEGYLGDNALFKYNADIVNGQALLRSDRLSTDAVLLAVLDKAGALTLGGTQDTINGWLESGSSVDIIDIKPIRELASVESDNSLSNHESPERRTNRLSRKIRTMLFADVVGFSKLDESQAPSFFVDFLGEVAELLNVQDPAPLFRNSWGDGLFIVFDDIQSAADFSLKLRDKVLKTNWDEKGLPKETSIRIALHAGPVYETFDPIIKQNNFFGSHVNRAARIEPITSPGSVFISEQTASLIILDNKNKLVADYLGEIALAKKYGGGRLFRLRREDEFE